MNIVEELDFLKSETKEAQLVCESSKQSKCFYCGSLSYGKGCAYGPGGVHVHLEDPKKCIYCGSLSYGRGCKVNPTSDLHIHGIQFNTLLRENLERDVVLETLIRKYLTGDLTQTEPFKAGLIDENGNILRECQSEQDYALLSPLAKTLLRARRFMGPKRDLLNLGMLQESKSPEPEHSQYWENKIADIMNELHEAVQQAQAEGASTEWILQRFLK
jgi:hypothetical protein